MFLGEYEHSVDNKGRLAIPAKFRQRLGEGAVMTRGLDNCLVIYPADKWQEMASKLDALPSVEEAVRTYKRFVFSSAVECDFDRQGRVLIPAFLRTSATIGETAMVVGQFSLVEVWSTTTWQERRAADQETVSAAAQKLATLGLAL